MRIVKLPIAWECEHEGCENEAFTLIMNDEEEIGFEVLSDEDVCYECWNNDIGVALCDIHK